MFNLNVEVLNEMLLLKNSNEMFTVYDIRRILENKSGEILDHSEVRHWVEFYYSSVGLKREIGYQLSYSPPPQIYYAGRQDISKYNPDTLDPSKSKKASVGHSMSAVLATLSNNNIEYLYALVDNQTGKRVVPFKGNSIGLYKTRNGPQQLANSRGHRNTNFVIKQYEVTLKEVDA